MVAFVGVGAYAQMGGPSSLSSLEPGASTMLQSFDATTRKQPPAWGELLDLAEAMRYLAERATTAEGLPALQDLVDLTVERVPSARWASLTVRRAKTFR